MKNHVRQTAQPGRWYAVGRRVRAAVQGRTLLVVLVVLLTATNVATLWSLEQARNIAAAKPRARPYPLISPLRGLIPQEYFLTTLEPLRANIKAFVAAQSLRTSVYIEYLNTGSNINVNQEFRFWPASLTKVPIALATMKTIEDGTWSLQHTLTLSDADRNSVSSGLFRYPAGTTFTIATLLEELLVHSDNTAYAVLLRNLPPGELNEMQDAIGLEALFDATGKITAKEYSRFLRTLYTSSYLAEQNSQYLLELMNRSEFRYFLSWEIPDSVPFPHKWGSYPRDHVYGDAGIAYIRNGPYMITVLIQGNGEADERAKAQAVMHRLSAMAYEYFSHAW